MYTLKSIAQRSTMLGAVFALVAAAFIPAAAVFADSLNPLTERSLLLSSSAPGYVDTDGSGNSAGAPNSIGENYAPAGSGPNGKKSGETFTFKVSSTADVKGFSLQYCTTAAGVCQAPGNNDGDARVGATTPRETNAVAHPQNQSDLDYVGAWTEGTGAGQFSVTVGGAPSTGWTLQATNLEDTAHSGALTGKKNYVTLVNSGAGQIANGQVVVLNFNASENTYITNPGEGHFFVKINTHNVSDRTTFIGNFNDPTPGDNDDSDHTVIDGGVTVANVMTDSIHITTKVLETMAFSVGTQNPDTIVQAQPQDHGTCQAMLQPNGNRLNLGNPDAEYSLETTRGWDVNSYWRLSSNSSGGATVYYSGSTLQNTVGDEIAPMNLKANSLPGTEQFGLGFVSAIGGTYGDTLSSTFNTQMTNNPGRYKTPSSYPFTTVAGQSTQTEVDAGDGRDFTALPNQPVSSDYANAEGTLNVGSAQGSAQFKFVPESSTVPEPIAQQNNQVISCATAKMRYVGNIGADTPAGVYTTKINYLAAPQY